MNLIDSLFNVMAHNSTILWILFFAFIFWLAAVFTTILGHWHHTFDKVNFSALECYKKIEAGLKAREVPDMRLTRTTYRESVVFGAEREYLRIIRGDYVFDVCVAPFGTGMYASWWFVDETNRITRIFRRLPIISYFYSRITYHQIDTELMFRDLVHLVVLEALDAMTEPHGVRMNEYDRRIQDSSSYNIRRR